MEEIDLGALPWQFTDAVAFLTLQPPYNTDYEAYCELAHTGIDQDYSNLRSSLASYEDKIAQLNELLSQRHPSKELLELQETCNTIVYIVGEASAVYNNINELFRSVSTDGENHKFSATYWVLLSKMGFERTRFKTIDIYEEFKLIIQSLDKKPSKLGAGVREYIEFNLRELPDRREKCVSCYDEGCEVPIDKILSPIDNAIANLRKMEGQIRALNIIQEGILESKAKARVQYLKLKQG